MKNLIIYNPNTFKFSEKFEVNDKDSLNVSRLADVPRWLHKVFDLVRPRTFAVPLLSDDPSDRFALVAQGRLTVVERGGVRGILSSELKKFKSHS